MMNWNLSTDCCTWDGVTCNHFSGDVIGLDLSCGMLQGTIHPNTTLFHLPHLQRLNLAYNDLYPSYLPHEIGRFANSLTHLNISCWGFTGQIPLEISLLSKLVSLDLSWNYFRFGPHVFENLLRNSTILKELSLRDVDISSNLPTNLNFSSSLKLLDLRFTGLQGKLPDNIFDLQYLEKLDLSGNLFTGQIPSQISHLPKLVYLSLSFNVLLLPIPPLVLNNLLQNATLLRELSLSYVNISLVLPTYLNISSSLKLLDLQSTGLQGKLPDNIFNLQYLETLYLSSNFDLTGPFPKVNISSSLKLLNLRSTGLQGKVPDNIFNLQYLEELDLSANQHLTGPFPKVNISSSLKLLELSSTCIQGKLPDNIFNLQYLETLDLSYNNYLTGPLPKVNKSISNSLKWLDLSETNFLRDIPYSIGHLKSLITLELSYCNLVGSLPKSLVNLRNLTTLDLSYNSLNGTLPYWLFTLPSLENIHLDYNMFSGSLPLELFNRRSLKKLSLGYNQFVGEIDVFDQVPIPQSFRQLIDLISIDLSFNNFTGVWELDTLLSSLTKLRVLQLSYSGLSVVTNNDIHYVNPDFWWLSLASCKLTVFPECIRAMRKLRQLDLSRNEIHGRIPDWVGERGGNQLYYLNLSHNFITSLPQFQLDRLEVLFLKSNPIQGPLPPSICNLSNLAHLDMSNNRLGGVIPQCFANMIGSSLYMVDLRNNRFHGTIPNIYEDCGRLEGLVLNGNQLEGEVPSTLSKCRSLKILDLGNNRLNGTFPHWSGALPKLQVLVLKSNNLHGPIETSSTIELPFPSLKVLDLSHNKFVGNLPGKYFQIFIAMKNVVKKGTKPEYIKAGGQDYSVICVVKGVEQMFLKILVDYTIVDLSKNRFEKEIPDIIGSLNSLIVLNLSHNNLIGRIPHVLGNLTEIESLDLSWNQLIGEIPQSLAGITTLAVLNLSQNHLVGRIPQGKQFNTFEGNSFGGNLGLCGSPLPKHCEHVRFPQRPAAEDTENGFTWKAVMLGYGCGTLLGLVMGYLMLLTGRPKWFNAIAKAGEHMIQRRQNKRRYVYIGK